VRSGTATSRLMEEMLTRKYLWVSEDREFRSESKRRDNLSEIRALSESDMAEVEKKMHR
jgi:hypothetical protein